MRQASNLPRRGGAIRPLLAALLAAGLVLAGCAGDGADEVDDGTEQAEDTDPTATDDGTGSENETMADDTATDDGDDAADDEEAPADGGVGGESAGVATIAFDSGETLSTDVFCVLEPQAAATGGQILYTTTSLENPYFDLTVFADGDGTVTEASVSWDETEDFETYQESWSAGGFGSDLEVSLDGTTITGSGTFVRGSDESGQQGETRPADVTVECG